MTDADLLAAIDANPAAKALAEIGRDNACADWLTANLPHVLNGARVTYDSILHALSPTDAGAIMAAIETQAATNPVWKWADKMLDVGGPGLEINNPNVQASLASLNLAAPTMAALTALGTQPQTISHGDVSRVYFNAGRRNGSVIGGV